eukprot:4986748-Prymnesium_polylepis.1
MKSHDCTRLSGSTIRLCAFAAGHASVCVPRTVRFPQRTRDFADLSAAASPVCRWARRDAWRTAVLL